MMDKKYDYLEGMDDDRAVMELEKMQANDKLELDAELAALVEQDNALISYRIEGLLAGKKQGRYKLRQTLSKEPPSLVIEDSEGSQVRFMLTENFVHHLKKSLTEVEHAYGGVIYRKEEKKVGSFKERATEYCKENPVKVGLTVIVLAFLAYLFI